MAQLMAGKWPDASENLLHFLNSAGTDKELDLARYLSEEPRIREENSAREYRIAMTAIDRAKATGSEGR